MGVALYIVRHGNTFGPDEQPRRVGSRTDLPLVESGWAQARRLGLWFAEQGCHFDHILCSPLRRTRETAEAIRAAQANPPAVTPSDLLAEIDHGPDENALEPDVIGRIGAEALAAWDEHGTPPPGWVVDREARLEEWRHLFAQRDAGNTLLVTSNGAARFALFANPGLAAQAAHLPSLKLRTGAFGVIRIDEAGLHVACWDRRP